MDSRSHGIEWLWAMAAFTVVVLCLFLSGCNHVHNVACVSHCGMLMDIGQGNGSMSCDQLDNAESVWINNANERFCSEDKRMCSKNACDAAFGWQINAGSDTRVYIPEGLLPDGGVGDLFPAIGYADCAQKVMWLGDNSDWRSGSYPHEMVHVAENCVSGWSGSERDAGLGDGHGGWEDHGMYDFIRDFREGRR